MDRITYEAVQNVFNNNNEIILSPFVEEYNFWVRFKGMNSHSFVALEMANREITKLKFHSTVIKAAILLQAEIAYSQTQVQK